MYSRLIGGSGVGVGEESGMDEEKRGEEGAGEVGGGDAGGDAGGDVEGARSSRVVCMSASVSMLSNSNPKSISLSLSAPS